MFSLVLAVIALVYASHRGMLSRLEAVVNEKTGRSNTVVGAPVVEYPREF